MTEYLVTWKVDIEADSPEEAAREALVQTSGCTVFEVQEVTYPEPGRWVLGDPVEVDL